MAQNQTPRSLSPTPTGPEGPFYRPGQQVRSNIREDREGLLLTMQFNVKDVKNEGKPISNACVHAWHADALGVYSGYLSLYPLEVHRDKNGSPGSNAHVEPTDDLTFLRGIQFADSNGTAIFQTIYPGWYGARTPHIHFKVFVNEKECYTGEVYFDDSLTDEVCSVAKPYCERDSANKKDNATDPVFNINSGQKAVATVEGDVNTALHGVLDVLIVT